MTDTSSRTSGSSRDSDRLRLFTIGSDDAGIRLDSFIRKILPHYPLSLLYKWIRKKKIKVNKKKSHHSYRLARNDTVSIYIHPTEKARESMEYKIAASDPNSAGYPVPDLENELILHEDEKILVLNKPADLPVHGGSKIRGPHLTDIVRKHCQNEWNDSHIYTISPVHRLDRETSGVIVYAKQRQVHKTLSKHLRELRWQKTYVCLVEGHYPGIYREIDTPLPTKKQPEKVESATTILKEKAIGKNVTLLEITITHGRFRQIRRHLADNGFRICGERRYFPAESRSANRRKSQKYRRLFLHSWKLRLRNTIGTTMTFTAPIPPEFRNYCK